MSGGWAKGAYPVEGQLYVYRDGETHDAIAVARHAVGPKGGWTADTIAKMSVPSKRVAQSELNKFADLFAEACTVANEINMSPRQLADHNADLLAALVALQIQAMQSPDLLKTDYGQEAIAKAGAAIAKAGAA